jgi:CIC family chloride channel protein
VIPRTANVRHALANIWPSIVRPRLSRQRLIADAFLLGVCGAIAAQVFGLLLRGTTSLFLLHLAGYQAPGLPNEGGVLQQVIGRHGLWLVPVATTIGGLAVGLITQWLGPEAAGHGTDTVIRAFHWKDGALRARVPIVKLVASAITIGSGGSAGREGPIALVTAGFGSLYASLTRREGRDRRLLLVIGMAAGLSAIFRSPIGTALFAIEVLYADMQFESGALLYAMLASIVAYAVNGAISGWEPLFRVPSTIEQLHAAGDYGWFIVLGVGAGVLGTILPALFYAVRDLFLRMPVKPFLRPAIGGLLTGMLALVLPQVIGGGYGWIQEAINGQLLLGTLLVLVGAKMVALTFTVASGGSGGVFAPSLFIGAMFGGACAAVFHQPPLPFVIVGMAAVFAGAAHVPVATLMMVVEMTGGYALLVPAALAVMLSYLVQMQLSSRLKYRSIYEAQVASRADSPAHRAQHVDIALRILREQAPGYLAGVGELELLPLLRSGMPIELPGERRLIVGVLHADSPFVDTTVGASGRKLDGVGSNIIAILRGEHMLVPDADTRLEAGDRLILVVREAGIEQLRTHFDLW